MYHSHVFEHLDRDDAEQFLAENVRVLKPGGVLRVVVPDLERICRDYMESLEAVERGEPGAHESYEWILIELLDQMVRRGESGRVPAFFAQCDVRSNPRIAQRLSLDMQYVSAGRRPPGPRLDGNGRGGLSALTRRAGRAVARVRRNLGWAAVAAIGGRNLASAFEEGVFRATGEVHRWMYDRFSLRRALERAGLVDIAFRGPDDSLIPDFAAYELDRLGGRVRKPGSLYAEARKPALN